MAVNSVTPAQQDAIAGLYAAFWNRAPDTTGFGFWVNKLASGEATLDQIATEFRNAPEGVAEYPLWSTNEELVTEVYNNVFGRAPDAQGLAFWTQALNQGRATFPELVVDMIIAAETNGSNDGLLFTNKVIVGVYVATVAQTDNGYVCDNAFQYVTYEASSVATAEAWVDANNTGATYTLTTNIDTINVDGQSVNTVSGIMGASATYNTGDTVNGNGRTNVALVADGAAGGNGAIVDLNNVANVNLNLVSATTLNELEFTDVAAVTITNGVAGTTLTVTNADQATVHGMAKAGRNFTETITYASTTGTADTAALSVAGTGTSTTDSTFNVQNSNAIEAVTLATSGTNYVTVNGGTGAASYTITGSGTNEITIGSAATTMTVDASATTGDNILNVGTLLSTTDSVLGGSGNDVLVANLTSAVQMIPTVSGVEELDLTFTAAAIYNASKSTGVEVVDITPTGAVNASITNLADTATEINIGTSAAITATGTVGISYATGSNSDVTLNVGATSSNSNPAVSSTGAMTISNNAGALTINSVGDAANTLGAVTANKVSSLTIAGVAQALTTGALSATAASTILVDGTLKNTTVVGGITADESLTTYNVTSGAGTVADSALAQTAATGAIETVYTYTGGAKGLTGGGATVSTAAADTDLTAVVNVTAAAGAVTVGALSFTGSGALAADVTSVSLTAEGTASTGTVGLTGLTVDEGVAGTSSTTVNLQGNGGAVTMTALTLTASDTNTISLNAASSNVTLTTLTNTASTTTDLFVSAASGYTSTIGTLAGTGNLNSITVDGAGTVSLFNTGTSAVTGDTVVDATGLTGALTLGLGSAAGNLNVTLGNVVSGSSNTVRTGAGADVIVGGTGADNLNAGSAADNVNGGAGADSITGGTGADYLTGGTGADVFTQVAGASVVATASTIAAAYADGSTITYGNSVDIISDFVSGTDTIDTTTAGAVTNLSGVALAALTANANYYLRGDWNATTGVFTVNSATGADSMVIADAVAALLSANSQTDAIILTGVTSLTAADFV